MLHMQLNSKNFHLYIKVADKQTCRHVDWK